MMTNHQRRQPRPMPFGKLAPGSMFRIVAEPSRRDPVTGRVPTPYHDVCIKASDAVARSTTEDRDVILALNDLVRPLCSPAAARQNILSYAKR